MPTEYEIVLATPDCNLMGGWGGKKFEFEVVLFRGKAYG